MLIENWACCCLWEMFRNLPIAGFGREMEHYQQIHCLLVAFTRAIRVTHNAGTSYEQGSYTLTTTTMTIVTT